MVNKTDAIEIIHWAFDHGISVWLDGGWGVDALLGRQTRPHNDIDLFIELKHRDLFIKILLEKNFKEITKSYTTYDHTVWKDPLDRIIDLHTFRWNSDKSIIYDGMEFPGNTFDGIGKIDDITVNCINAQSQVEFHRGYEFSDKDIHDVKLLCETFNIPVPEEYKDKI